MLRNSFMAVNAKKFHPRGRSDMGRHDVCLYREMISEVNKVVLLKKMGTRSTVI